MKYYVVKKGHKTGIFDNWSDCQDATKGYSGAEFKSFVSKEEAEAYLNGNNLWDEKVKTDIESGYTVAFTDGSFIDGIEKYGYGVIILKSTNNFEQLCGSLNNPKYLSSRNVSGEVFAVINALDWAISNNISKIKIYHDYEGISKWINKEWQANSDIATTYVALYENKFKDLLSVDFEHVKGHSNCKYNDMADKLAKAALEGNQHLKVSGDNWFKLQTISKSSFNAIIDLLKEDSVIVEEKPIANGTKYDLKQDSSILHLTYFNNQTVLLQGKQSSLFQLSLSVMGELLKFDVTEVMGNAYRKNIDKANIENEFNSLFTYIPSDYPPGYITQIKQAIINLTYYIESEDYSFYAVPALRALEGHIKYMIKKYASYTIDKTFDCFNKDSGTLNYYLSISISDSDRKQQIEDCYNYYKSERDTIDHAGDLLGSVDNTRIISDKKRVDEIIKKSLSLINTQLLTI